MREKITNCKACGQQIAKSAKKCPHCGAKNKKGIPVWLGIVVAIVLIAIIAATSNDEPKKVGDVATPTTSNTETKEPAKTEKAKRQASTNAIKEINNNFFFIIFSFIIV